MSGLSAGAPALGTPRLHLRRTDSTNDRARQLALAGAPHGTLVTAGEQTAGRGRQGRAWCAPPGRALLASVVLREVPALLTLASAVAVADVAGAGASIKWPNDVLLDGRKVAGILAETRAREDWAVLGIGINVAVRAEDLPAPIAASAAGLGLQVADVERVLGELLEALRRRLAQGSAAIIAAYRARDALRGHELRTSYGGGVAAGVDDAGRLLVDLVGGDRVALQAGEVHLGGLDEIRTSP